jgi:leucyl-tRNA synthetase
MHVRTLILLLAPLAPHLAEELWQHLGQTRSVHLAEWPDFDAVDLVEDQIEIAVQVNGKVRGRLMVGVDWTDRQVQEAALAHQALAPYVSGHEIKKVVVIPTRLVNVVVA